MFGLHNNGRDLNLNLNLRDKEMKSLPLNSQAGQNNCWLQLLVRVDTMVTMIMEKMEEKEEKVMMEETLMMEGNVMATDVR